MTQPDTQPAMQLHMTYSCQRDSEATSQVWRSNIQLSKRAPSSRCRPPPSGLLWSVSNAGHRSLVVLVPWHLQKQVAMVSQEVITTVRVSCKPVTVMKCTVWCAAQMPAGHCLTLPYIALHCRLRLRRPPALCSRCCSLPCCLNASNARYP